MAKPVFTALSLRWRCLLKVSVSYCHLTWLHAWGALCTSVHLFAASNKMQKMQQAKNTTTKKHIFPQEVRIFDRGIQVFLSNYCRNMYCRERPDANLNTGWDQNFGHMSYMTSTWGLGLILDFNNGLDSKLLSVGVVIWVMVVMKSDWK